MYHSRVSNINIIKQLKLISICISNRSCLFFHWLVETLYDIIILFYLRLVFGNLRII